LPDLNALIKYSSSLPAMGGLTNGNLFIYFLFI
jgi:hypothetical protein